MYYHIEHWQGQEELYSIESRPRLQISQTHYPFPVLLVSGHYQRMIKSNVDNPKAFLRLP